MHYFLHFGIHENGLTITQNALILHLVGALPPTPASGSSAPAPQLGTQPTGPLRLPPRTIFWIRH